MLEVIISIILSLSTLMGLSQPVSQPASPALEQVQPAPVAALEPAPVAPMHPSEVDAWDTIANLPLTPANDRQVLAYAATVNHVPVALPIGYWSIPSKTAPQTYHLFKWEEHWTT